MIDQKQELQGGVKNVRYEGDIVVLTLVGAIDMYCSTDFRSELLNILQKKPPMIIINMSDVTFMDSSGLAVLVEALQLSRLHEMHLKLVGLHPRVRAIFEISRLEKMFQIVDTEAEALKQ